MDLIDQSIPTMTENFEHPEVEMEAALNGPQDLLDILEREFNRAEYFLVLEYPEKENNEKSGHENGVAIRETTRTSLASRTDNIELMNHTTQSEDSGSVVSDLADTPDTDGKKELSACTRSMAVLTNLKESDVSDEFNSNKEGSLLQRSSDAANLNHRLRNRSSKKKIGQSTSSNIIIGKTGSRNSNKISISGPSLKVHRQKKFKCYFCEKVCPSSSHLENHIRVHTREKPFNCSICAKTFSDVHSVRRHKKGHTGERPFKCTVCANAFVRLHNLKRHERIHTGERPFKCSNCAKAFADRSNLKAHEKNHTGERLFKCTFCTKAFPLLSSLEKHVRSHTREKPMKCSFCTKTFSESSNLKEHERIHTGERPYKCTFCAKSFAQRSACKRHEIRHTVEKKSFKCSYCTKGFSNLYYARKHERTHTGERQ